MKNKLVLGLVLALLIVAVLAGITHAQTGDGYDLSWNVVGGGGSQAMAGSGFSLDSTAGQAAVGNMQGGTFEMCSGFWCGIEEWVWKVFLPIVLHAYP